MDDIRSIIKPLQDVGIYIKGFSKTVKNEIKEQKCEFLCILLGIGDRAGTRAGTGARKAEITIDNKFLFCSIF